MVQVTAVCDTVCLLLDRVTFKRLLGHRIVPSSSFPCELLTIACHRCIVGKGPLENILIENENMYQVTEEWRRGWDLTHQNQFLITSAPLVTIYSFKWTQRKHENKFEGLFPFLQDLLSQLWNHSNQTLGHPKYYQFCTNSIYSVWYDIPYEQHFNCNCKQVRRYAAIQFIIDERGSCPPIE